MAARENTPAGIEHALTLDILRGTYAPGIRLPTVRELARKFSVNPATIQRVVARLETRGLITARQGSGLRVNDPHLVGDISLVRYWLEAAFDDPEHAARILDDFLVVRRVIAARLLVRYRGRLLEQIGSLAKAATAMMESDTSDRVALRDADLAFVRLVLQTTGNSVAVAVFNTIVRVLEELPVVTRAMYAEPELNVALMARVMLAFRDGPENLGDLVESAMAEVDDRTVSRLRALLRERAGTAE